MTLRLRSGQALLLKWFLDLNVIDPAFDPTAFSHNKERLLRHEVARQFYDQVIEEARRPARGSARKRSFFPGHVLTENRNPDGSGVVDVTLTLATGTAVGRVALSHGRAVAPGAVLPASPAYGPLGTPLQELVHVGDAKAPVSPPSDANHREQSRIAPAPDRVRVGVE